jgi:DNA repair protein RadC
MFKVKNKLILNFKHAHFHPSGDPTPSKEDINITRKIMQAGEIVGIHVIDHVIIGKGNYFSMKDAGFMDQN